MPHAWSLGALVLSSDRSEWASGWRWKLPRIPKIMQDRSSGQLIDALTERRTAVKAYEFSIIASGLDPSTDDFEARFYDAGCDDATISFQKGHIIVDFAREADSVDRAIVSAIECVKVAGATVDRVEPDPLVNLSDIAARTGMTRAAMSQYSKGQGAKISRRRSRGSPRTARFGTGRLLRGGCLSTTS
jgi:hypothetical protein